MKALATECGQAVEQRRRRAVSGIGGSRRAGSAAHRRPGHRREARCFRTASTTSRPIVAAQRLAGRYVTYLTTIYRATGRAEPEVDAANVLELETALARAQTPRRAAACRSRSAEAFSLRDLHERMPGFDWTAWAKPQGLDRASVDHPRSAGVLQRIRQARRRTFRCGRWKAWLAARYITAISPFSIKALHDARFEFFGRVLTGQQAPRAALEAGRLARQRPHGGRRRPAVRRRSISDAASRDRIEKLVENLLEAYRQAVNEADWMAPATRRHALGKLDRLETRIGHPDAVARLQPARSPRRRSDGQRRTRAEVRQCATRRGGWRGGPNPITGSSRRRRSMPPTCRGATKSFFRPRCFSRRCSIPTPTTR